MAEHATGKEEYAKEQHDSRKTQDNIPIVNLAGIEGPERQTICKQIAEACETWGFFHLINHGIDQSLIKRTKDVSREFFHGPEEEKLKISVQMPSIYGWNRSDRLFEGNNLIQKDTVEFLLTFFTPERPDCLDSHPQYPASYKSTLLEYTKELSILGEKVLGVLSEGLGLAPEALQTALTASSPSQCQAVTMRTNFYGLNEDGEALPGVCHAHSDPGGLSILLADDVPGLEVRKDDRWVKVDPIPGGFIVNIADQIEVCSNGRYKSVNHRGLPSHRQERLVLATFQAPQFDAVIGPIESLLDESHPPIYKTSSFGAYIAEFVKIGLEGKNALEHQKL